MTSLLFFIVAATTPTARAQMSLPGTYVTAAPLNYEIWELHSDGVTPAFYVGSAAEPVWSVVDPSNPNDLPYFKVRICPAAYATKTLEAIDDYDVGGIPFERQISSIYNCQYPPNPANPEGDWLYSPTEGSQGQRLMDTRNQISIVYPGDDRWDELALGSNHVAATTKLNGIQYRNENGTVIGMETNWDIIINGRDFDYLSSCPSRALDFDAKSQGIYQYDIIAHELLHVLGGHHIYQTSLFNPAASDVHSVMWIDVGKGGHFGTEAFGDPFNPSPYGGDCGENNTPLSDQLFLEMAWPSQYVVDPGEYLYHWKYESYKGGYRAVPPGWGNGTPSLGAFCPDDVLSSQDLDLIEDLSPRFTSAATSGNVFMNYTALYGEYSTGGSLLSNEVVGLGLGSYGQLGTGVWWPSSYVGPDGEVDPINGTTGDPYDKEYYVKVGMQVFDGPPATYLAAKLYIKKECGVDEDPLADFCCAP